MRLSDEEVRARFEESVRCSGLEYCNTEDAIDFALRLARDLQAPPTGEEVERALTESTIALDAYAILAARARKTAPEDRAIVVAAIEAYGAACAAAARAEAGNCEPTDATESEAFCALKNRLTDLLNSRGHYREMTAYQGALEQYREAVASAARAEAGKAADVLRMMCEALLQDTQSESLTAEHWRVIVRGMAESALDQLAAETKKGR